MRGESERQKAFVHDQGFYEQQQIELIAGHAATTLDLTARQISLDDGRTVHYDKLLLATGAERRRPAVPGCELEGILYLRTVDDSDATRLYLHRTGSAGRDLGPTRDVRI